MRTRTSRGRAHESRRAWNFSRMSSIRISFLGRTSINPGKGSARSTRRRVDRDGGFIRGLNHRLARLQKHRLEIEVTLNGAHDIVCDDPAVAKIQDCFLLGDEHRPANSTVLD